ncbi:MAG: peptidylprolyl isomerase [Saprospiraceae bacterium]|nr:peptidylprolyl isomerase [Saprospiraceae bacterium]
MAIQKNQVVILHYKLQEENEQGELVESTFDAEPLKFIFGIGQMIPAFEQNLEQKNEEDDFAFSIVAEDAYGLYDERAVANIPLTDFAVDGEINPESIELGRPITLQDQQGNTYQGVITEVGSESVKVDFNHPMAGVDLYFTGKILTIREATASELDHGHVHE